MSKMADLDMEIRTLLAEGVKPSVIVEALNVPMDWVYATITGPKDEELSPFRTINS